MDKPRTLSDIRIAFPCPSCSGLGRTGSTDCSYCQATGWEIRDAIRLTPRERERLLAKLPKDGGDTGA